jgi:hypothetical protein
MDMLLDDPRQEPWPDPEAFPHGAFMVEPDGALRPQGCPALRFAWRGRPCEARIAEGQVALSALAGAVPYTGERPSDRPGVLAEIGRLPSALPPGWRLRLLPDHRIRLEAMSALPEPVQVAALIAAMVAFALALDPYLDRLEAAGAA